MIRNKVYVSTTKFISRSSRSTHHIVVFANTLHTVSHTHTATVAMRSCSLVSWSEVCLVEHLFGIIYYIYSTIKHTWTWSILFVSRSRSSRPGSCSAYQSIAETHYSLVVHETALRDNSRLQRDDLKLFIIIIIPMEVLGAALFAHKKIMIITHFPGAAKIIYNARNSQLASETKYVILFDTRTPRAPLACSEAVCGTFAFTLDSKCLQFVQNLTAHNSYDGRHYYYCI